MLNRIMRFASFISYSSSSARSTAAIALLCAAFTLPSLAQVTALTNTNPTSTTRYLAGDSAAGEPLSPYFTVSAGLSGSLTPLYVYKAQVKSINFPTFTSDLTGLPYQYTISDSDPRGPYTYNLGTASFASFQPSVSGGTNVVQVGFHTGYPHVPLTSTSQIKFLSNVEDGGIENSNISNISVSGGVLTFSIKERVDTAGHGIPEQLTIEFGSGAGQDFLNSLHIFINPHPDTTNGVPGGAYTVSPGSSITQGSFPTGNTAYHLTPGQYWMNTTSPNSDITFNNVEVYMDDGAIIKWITPTWPTQNTGTMITVKNTTGNGIFRGWGIIDGQAQQQQVAEGLSNAHGPIPNNCGYGASPFDLYHPAASATQTALVDGIVIDNSCAFNFPVWNAKGTVVGSTTYSVNINNVKILGYSGATTPGTSNADGIDVFSGQYLNITNSFIRTSDDLIALDQNGYDSSAVPTTNINIVNNTFWNEVAHATVLGAETYNAPNINQPTNPLAMDNIRFDTNTIIHDTGKAPLMAVLANYGGKIQNVLFSNVTVYQAVGLIGIDLNVQQPTTMLWKTGDAGTAPTPAVSYSMAPTTGSGSTLQSVVTFNTVAQGAPVVLGGQIIQLAGFTAAGGPGYGEGFNGKYATVLGTPTPTSTSFAAAVLVPTPITTTTTGIESAASVTLLPVPGDSEGFRFCKIAQLHQQVKTTADPGTNRPYLAPIPNIQFVVSLIKGNPYQGGVMLPTGVTPTPSGTPYTLGTVYPKIMNLPVQFSDVTTVLEPPMGSPTTQTVLTYTPGNDFYYQASDGLAATNSTPIAQNTVEQTVRVRNYGETNPNQIFDYYTSQISGDMANPLIYNPPNTCSASSLVPVPAP